MMMMMMMMMAAVAVSMPWVGVLVRVRVRVAGVLPVAALPQVGVAGVLRLLLTLVLTLALALVRIVAIYVGRESPVAPTRALARSAAPPRLRVRVRMF